VNWVADFGSDGALRRLNLKGRAALDAGVGKGDSSGMEDRIAVLEKDVDDLSLLRKDVAQLQRDLARLKEEVVAIEFMKRNAQLSDVATKADLKEFA
jgi:hypothetical protein